MSYNPWGRTVEPTASYHISIDRLEGDWHRCAIHIGNTPISIQYATSAIGALKLCRMVVRMRRIHGQIKKLRGLT